MSDESASGLHTGSLTGQVKDKLGITLLALKHVTDDLRTNHGRITDDNYLH